MEEGNVPDINNNNLPNHGTQIHDINLEGNEKLRNSTNLFEDLLARQMGNRIGRQPQRFLYDVQSKKGFIQRLALYDELISHRGCVNTICWNSTGTLLASGSDDTNVCIWRYPSNEHVATLQTDHMANIFCVKFLPLTNDEQILTCAGDNRIKLFNIRDIKRPICVDYKCHRGRVKKLAVDSTNPHLFWSASEDGTIRQFDTRINHICRRNEPCDNLLINLQGKTAPIDIYSISMNQQNTNYFAICGCDPIIRVYDRRMVGPGLENYGRRQETVKKFCPTHIGQLGRSKWGHVSGVAYSPDGTEIVANYSGERVYLFDVNNTKETKLSEYAILSPQEKREKLMTLTSEQLRQKGNKAAQKHKYRLALYYYNLGIEKGPTAALYYNRGVVKNSLRNEHLVSALEDFDKALEMDPTLKKAYFMKAKTLFYQQRWEEAKQAAELALTQLPEFQQEIEDLLQQINRYQNSDIPVIMGGHMLETSSGESEEEEKHETSVGEIIYDGSFKQCYSGHCNVRTVKEVSFIGQHGDYVASGSDDGNIFIWDKRTAEIVNCLEGDEDVVNCVQSHPFDCVLASSGIERTVKLWAPTRKTPNKLKKLDEIVERNQERARERTEVLPLSILRQLTRIRAEMLNAEAEVNEEAVPPGCVNQ